MVPSLLQGRRHCPLRLGLVAWSNGASAVLVCGFVLRNSENRAEEVLHALLLQVPRDEHELSSPVRRRPGFELLRRMGEMLHEMHDDRTRTSHDIDEAFHAQEIGAAQARERVEGTREHRPGEWPVDRDHERDRKSTRLNSSHANISYAVFCLKKT